MKISTPLRKKEECRVSATHYLRGPEQNKKLLDVEEAGKYDPQSREKTVQRKITKDDSDIGISHKIFNTAITNMCKTLT